MTRRIGRIILHCSYTPPSQDIGMATIREWHTSPDPNDPSKPWSAEGYHYGIRRSGEWEVGRPETRMGAHARGHNADSLGIVLIGGMAAGDRRPECNFTVAQWEELARRLRWLRTRFPNIPIIGHGDVDRGRACPTFNAREFALWL